MNKIKKLKVVTLVGTRPEIIRLSRVMAKLDKYTNHKLVHTGQNYDYELNQIFFDDLNLRKPDYFFNVKVSSLGVTVGEIISKTEEYLTFEKPDAFLVLGDTNSCLSAYIAKRLRIPIFHMEAGNRCFDLNVPEEINRRLIDHLADINFVYTEHARRHLISEGIPHRNIYLTGSPMNEVLSYYKDKILQSNISHELRLKKNNYIIASIHREENVDNKNNLVSIFNSLESLAIKFKTTILVSTHPRTRKQLIKNKIKLSRKIIFYPPFSFTNYINLQMNALCTVSDSGTISEESSILNFPAVSIRNAMERPEAMDSGSIILTGLNENVIVNSVSTQIEHKKDNVHKEIPTDYKIINTSERVVNIILGLSKLVNRWNGIDSK